MYESFSILFALAALLSFINYRWLKLPNTIGQLILALGISVLVWIIRYPLPNVFNFFNEMVLDTNFTHILLDIMLGFLLFAGALHVDINDLNKERWVVLLFTTIGVLISTFLVGSGLFFLTRALDLSLPYIHCLLFGALISPTDPIAVLALLKTSNVSTSLRLKIEGESLFNDGVGVIVFSGVMLFTDIGEMNGPIGAQDNIALSVFHLFVREVLLGLSLGGVLGLVGFRMMKMVAGDPFLTTMLSLAIVFGGYSLAEVLHTSGPLAMVVAGLYIGNHIKRAHFNNKAKNTLTGFWEVLDEGLNGVLFVFLGLAIHLVKPNGTLFILALLTILLVLLSRFISVAIPYALLHHQEHSWIKTTYILTWGGLRGGISLALAFSLAPELSRDTLVLLTYSAVLFSILVQGLTIPKMVNVLS